MRSDHRLELFHQDLGSVPREILVCRLPLTNHVLHPLLIRLDDRMLDLDEPVKVTQKGKVLFEGVVPRMAATLAKTLVGRGDHKLVFDAEIAVDLGN